LRFHRSSQTPINGPNNACGKKPASAAIINTIGEKITYRDVINIYETVEIFLREKSVGEVDRIAILTKTEINLGVLILPIMNNAILIPIKPDMPEEMFEYNFKLLGVDYILTDDISCAGCIVAEKMGLGIFAFQISYKTNKIIFFQFLIS